MHPARSNISRRRFLAGSLAAAAVGAAASRSRILGANDRIRLGVIGAGGRSRSLMGDLNRLGDNIQWVALADAWDTRCRETEELRTGPVEKYRDWRKLLDRQDIDGVIIGTFDHVHARLTVAACQAGKDVYVEKPMTSRPEQGMEVVRVARETGRVVQVGMQQRSIPHFLEAKEKFFDSGRIGQVGMVRTIWNGNGGYTFPVPAGMERCPADLNWESCLDWLPKRPWNPQMYFNRFAWDEFSTGGMTGGLFVHMVDVVHMMLGLDRCEAAAGLGGTYTYRDGRDTADNINLVVKYPGGLNVTFEATITDMKSPEVADIVFMGTGGRLSIFRSGYTFWGGSELMEQVQVPYASTAEHLADWLSCMRSRQAPRATAVEGHYSALACHLGNLACRENRVVKWNKEWEV